MHQERGYYVDPIYCYNDVMQLSPLYQENAGLAKDFFDKKIEGVI